jgi:LPXTG-motif cell wall-anchored protein
MGMAMSNALALMRWPASRSLHRFFRGDFRSNDLIWLLIGLVLVVLVVWALRRRRRWF